MRTYSGPFLTEKGFVQAQVNVEEALDKEICTIVDYEEGGDEGTPSLIIPTPYNAHTHMGDSVVKEVPSGTLEEIVGPGGFKHRALERASKDDIIKSIRGYLQDAVGIGIRDIMEFREGGSQGIEMIRKAVEGMDDKPRLRIMSRPRSNTFDPEELHALLTNSQGIGLSAYRDWDESILIRIAEYVSEAGKPLALHCSEAVREPIDKVMELGVHHLVHMVEATDDDLTICAQEGIPIVICPRSNMYFGKIPDIPKMLRVGVTLCIGTDNAMISSPNIFREMDVAFRLSRLKGEVEPLQILLASTWNPRKALNLPGCIGHSYPEDNSKELYMILNQTMDNPAYEVVTKKGPKDVMEIVEW
ncbi:MAG: amidohydrolase family protein [Thermoplasmata archaeon]